MRIFTTNIFLLFLAVTMSGQVATADFENFGLQAGEFINQDMSGDGFQSGFISLPNNFNANYGSWSGWAISATTDVTTPGFSNQYSSFTGGGQDGSLTYAVAFEFGENIIRITDGNELVKGVVNGMYITNGTYAYLSMLEGDAFAKKFGGETGEDPDFFSAVFKGYNEGVLSTDSVEFFLADFRSSNPAEDYILDVWEWLDLSGLGAVDSVAVTMRSSDVGMFGINTPLYFCVDNIEVELDLTNTLDQNALELNVYPTLASDNLSINLPSQETAYLKAISIDGSPLLDFKFVGGEIELDISQFSAGYYLIEIQQGSKRGVRKFIKL